VTLPAFAAERRAAAPLLLSAPAAGTPIAVDRYLLLAGRSAANPPAAAAAVDRRTDGQTGLSTVSQTCSAHYAGSVNSKENN